MSWKYLEKYPPPAVRILARRRNGRIVALSDQEIAIEADLPLHRVVELARSRNWDDIPFGEIKKFCSGCGFDPFSSIDRNRAMALERYYQTTERRWQYLKSSGHWEDTYLPLIRILAEVRDVK